MNHTVVVNDRAWSRAEGGDPDRVVRGAHNTWREHAIKDTASREKNLIARCEGRLTVGVKVRLRGNEEVLGGRKGWGKQADRTAASNESCHTSAK